MTRSGSSAASINFRMPLRCRCFGLLHSDVKLGARNIAPLDLFEGDLRSGVQGMNRRSDRLLVGARIGQRADQHVPAESGERVQITNRGQY